MRFPRLRLSRRWRHAPDDDIQVAAIDAAESARRARAALAEQKWRAAAERLEVRDPLRQVRRANHIAAMIAESLARGGGTAG